MGRKTRLASSGTERRREAVETVRVIPAAWAVAVGLAGGDHRRIQVVSADELVVHNQPVSRRRP